MCSLAPMARAPEYARMLATMREFFRLIGRSSEGAHVIELDGVVGSVCPAVPERSLPNSVVYESEEALIAALPELAAHYADHVDAWTVWTPEADRRAAAALEEAGHKLDATPAAMTLDLAELGEPPELDYREGPDQLGTVHAINDNSYEFEGTPFTDMSVNRPAEATRNYVALLEGQAAAALSIIEHEGDAGVMEVATLPQARGRGLASRLMHRALWDSRERGCEISTLQATKKGEPVYTRLGYKSHGALEMWERRRLYVP